MESKESARLKEIRDGLNKIDMRLKEQNASLKSIAASLNAIRERIAAFKASHNMDISQEDQNELQ